MNMSECSCSAYRMSTLHYIPALVYKVTKEGIRVLAKMFILSVHHIIVHVIVICFDTSEDELCLACTEWELFVT